MKPMQYDIRKARPILLCVLLLVAAMQLVWLAQAQAQTGAGKDEASKFVESLYGKKIEAAIRSRDTEDNIKLMTEMLEIAPTLPAEPDVKSVLYVRIVSMSQKSRVGHEQALQALDALAEHKPGHPLAGPTARLNVYEAWYRISDRRERKVVAQTYFDQLVVFAEQALTEKDADAAKDLYSKASSIQRVNRLESDVDIRQKLIEVRALDRRQDEVKELKAVADAGNLTPRQAKRLVVILAIEMAQIDEAKAYARLVEDQAFAKGLLAAAAASVEDGAGQSGLTPGHYYEAGHWYAAQIDEPDLSEAGVQQALRLARQYLGTYIETTSQQSVDKARTVILLRQLDERFAQVDESDTGGRSQNVIRLLNPDKHLIKGNAFKVADGKVEVAHNTIMHLPVKAEGAYSISLKVTPLEARRDGLVVWMPVHGRTVRVFFDRGKNRASWFDGVQNLEVDGAKIRVERDKEMVVRIDVVPKEEGIVSLAVQVDDLPAWSWEGDSGELSVPKYGMPPHPQSFSVFMATKAVFSEIQINQ